MGCAGGGAARHTERRDGKHSEGQLPPARSLDFPGQEAAQSLGNTKAPPTTALLTLLYIKLFFAGMDKLDAGAHLRPYTEKYRYVAATFFTMIFTLLLETEYGLCAVKRH